MEEPVLDYIQHTLPGAPSTAAYLIFCTGDTIYSLEKDHRAGMTAQSSTFLVTCNHDRSDESDPGHLDAAAHGVSEIATGMEMIVACSIHRKQRIDKLWKRVVNKRRKQAKPAGGSSKAVKEQDVVKLVMDEYISNEETHYGVIMDPQAGTVIWRRLFPPEEEGA